jgi:hypothetical protein
MTTGEIALPNRILGGMFKPDGAGFVPGSVAVPVSGVYQQQMTVVVTVSGKVTSGYILACGTPEGHEQFFFRYYTPHFLGGQVYGDQDTNKAFHVPDVPSHHAFVFNSSGVHWYINGQSVYTASVAYNGTQGNDIYIGNRMDGTRAMAGTVTSVAVYGEALTAVQLRTLGTLEPKLSACVLTLLEMSYLLLILSIVCKQLHQLMFVCVQRRPTHRHSHKQRQDGPMKASPAEFAH